MDIGDNWCARTLTVSYIGCQRASRRAASQIPLPKEEVVTIDVLVAIGVPGRDFCNAHHWAGINDRSIMWTALVTEVAGVSGVAAAPCR